MRRPLVVAVLALAMLISSGAFAAASPPVSSSVSLAPQPSATIGTSVTLSGQLHLSSGSTYGKIVSLYYRPAGTTTWTFLKSARLGASGKYKFSRMLTGTAHFQVRFKSSTGILGSASADRVVTAIPAFSAVALKTTTTATVGSVATYTGRVHPALKGQPVWVQWYDGSWRKVAAARIGSDGRFTIGFTLSRVGVTKYRLHMPKSLPAASAATSSKSVTVYKWFKLATSQSLYTKYIGGKYFANAPGWELGGTNGAWGSNDLSVARKCKTFTATVGLWDGNYEPGFRAGFQLVNQSGAITVADQVPGNTAVAVTKNISSWTHLSMRTIKRAPQQLIGSAAWGEPRALCSKEPVFLGSSQTW